MPNGLTPQPVDIPILLPNQTPPKHAGPLGRLTSMVDSQIKHFLPSSQQAPQKVEVIPRDGFAALTAACRDSVTGAAVGSPDWNNPELLAPIGNQLLSVCDSIPRVNNGASWTYYGSKRVVTNQLSEDVLHTTNNVLGAPDEAYLSGVTCFVWTETSHSGPVTINTSMVAFRGDDGAWIRVPGGLFNTASGNALVRVVQDGTFFWVVFNTASTIGINVYDTNGALVATDVVTIPLVWTPTPGYWDIAAFNNAGSHYVLIAQPNAFSSTGTNVDARFSKCTVSGSVITIVTSAPPITSDCNGPIAFIDSTATGLPSVATTGAGGALWASEFTHAIVLSHAYQFGAVVAGSHIPDSLTGWMEANGAGAIAHVAYSLLSNFSPATGPPNDPGLRYTRSYACTRAGAASLTNQVNGVLLSSRAFQIDNDWYAATYYQSGGGTVSSTTAVPITPSGTLDYFTGASIQPVSVHSGDFATGAANVPMATAFGLVPPTQLIGSIPHNAGDNVIASSGTWKFLAGLFVGTGSAPFDGSSTFSSAAGAILHVSGCANAQNNGDWWVTGIGSNVNVDTESISLQGNAMVDETFGVGVTASLTQVWPVILPQNPAFGTPAPAYPDPVAAPYFIGGSATIAGATGVNAALNGTYSIFRMYFGQDWRGYKPPFFRLEPNSNLVLLTKTSGAAGVAGTPYFMGSPALLSISPLLANAWALSGLQGDHDTRAGINVSLAATGATQGANNGAFPETSNPMPGSPYGLFVDVTGAQAAQRAEIFAAGSTTRSIPTVKRILTDPAQVLLLHINAITFDPSYLNATVTMTGMLRSENNNSNYQIVALATWIDTHTVVLSPIDGHTGQTLYNFTGAETVTITKDASAGTPAYQPCWYLTPLSIAQPVAGRWEWAIAYADWRHDGATVAGGTFERNGYPCALSSVTTGPTGKQFALPFRAQSFTAGQLVTNVQGGIIGVQSTAESTIGLKLFTLSSSPGLAVVNSGEMLLPGAQAGEFSASGFTEDGINLGPEQPFPVGPPTTAGIALGLTTGATYQYVVVWEVTSENGDRTWSVTSPPLAVTMTGTTNTATIGGRMPGPTMRVVGISIYRTANVGNPPTATIQHYKITNDLQVNGPGFTFSSVNGGAASDTWTFVDQIPDKLILSAETLYTDQGFLQRFPAPANRGGVGSWQNRTWVVGYDGAIWMSGEKDEGDSIWFHPAFRYVLPTDDKPVALASMDNYLLIFCSRSIWFIPAAQFPDATGANGILPTPQPLPFRNGCTGFAVTIKDGVAYSSTAGGVWLINRSLNNLYLSQPMQDTLGLVAINGMVVDGAQRLLVSTTSYVYVYDQLSQAWLQWLPQAAGPIQLTAWQGNAAYEGFGRVFTLVPGTFADVQDASRFGVAPGGSMTLVLGPVKAMKRVWAINVTGTVLAACQISFTLSYPDDPSQPATSFGPYTLAPGQLNVEINPLIEEATTYDLSWSGSFSGSPGASFTIELITAEVGIEPTMSKRPNAQRLPGS